MSTKPSGWPAEDGGSRRMQMWADPAFAPGPLRAITRDVLAATMIVWATPDRVLLLRHTLPVRTFRSPVTAWVERIDPYSLAPLERSPDLPSGPFWPGGLRAMPDGGALVVSGRWVHRLDAGLRPLAARQLHVNAPHNSFTQVSDGTVLVKDLDLDQRRPARLVALDPDTLAVRAELELPEAVVARLSADGDDVWAIGVRTAMRVRWDGTSLTLAARIPYRSTGSDDGGHAWDPVVALGAVWFLDHGDHRYVATLSGAGVWPGPVRLHRLDLATGAITSVPIGDGARGAQVAPPLVDEARRIVVGFDSAAERLRAFRIESNRLDPLWDARLAHGGHLLLHAPTGTLVAGHHVIPAGRHLHRALPARSALTAVLRAGPLRQALGWIAHEHTVLLDIETGVELSRAAWPSAFQGVLFPAPAPGGGIYVATFDKLARLDPAPSGRPAPASSTASTRPIRH